MMKKAFFITLLLFLSVFILAQNEQGLIKIPRPLHFQLKAIDNGEIMLKLDTRKQEFTIRPQKEANDTTIRFQWENKEKTAFLKYLNQNNTLGRLEDVSVSRPGNLKQSGRLMYLFIEKGSKKEEFWIRPETIKDSPEREFVSEFIQNLIIIYRNNAKRSQIPRLERR